MSDEENGPESVTLVGGAAAGVHPLPPRYRGRAGLGGVETIQVRIDDPTDPRWELRYAWAGPGPVFTFESRQPKPGHWDELLGEAAG